MLSTNTKNKQTQINFNALNSSYRQNVRVLPIALSGLTAFTILTGCDDDTIQQVSTQTTQPQANPATQLATSIRLSNKNQIKTGELLPQDLSQLGTVSFTPGNNNVPLNQQVQVQGGPVYCIGNLSTQKDGNITGFAAKNSSGQVRTYIAAGVSPQGQTCTPGTFVQNPILGTADESNKFADGSTPVSFYEYTPTGTQSAAVTTQPTAQSTTQEEVKIGAYQTTSQPTGGRIIDTVTQFSFDPSSLEQATPSINVEGMAVNKKTDQLSINYPQGRNIIFNNGTCLGEKTLGRNGNVSFIGLPNGNVLTLAGVDATCSQGEPINPYIGPADLSNKYEDGSTPVDVREYKVSNGQAQQVPLTIALNGNYSTFGQPGINDSLERGSEQPVVQPTITPTRSHQNDSTQRGTEGTPESTTQPPAVQPAKPPVEENRCTISNLPREVFRWNSPCFNPFNRQNN